MNIDVPPWNFQNIRPFLNDELVGCNQNKELSTITDIANEVVQLRKYSGKQQFQEAVCKLFHTYCGLKKEIYIICTVVVLL